MGVGIRGAPKTVGADDSEAGTCSHLHAQALAQAHAAEDAQQTHRAGRTVPAPPGSKRPAPPAVLPADGERSVARRVAAKTTLRHPTSSIMALMSGNGRLLLGTYSMPVAAQGVALNDWFDRIEAAHGVVNLSKCNVWSPTAAGTEHPDIQALGNAQSGSTGAAVATLNIQPPASGMRVVGHPIGSDDFCRAYYDDKAVKIEVLVSHLMELMEYRNDLALQSAYLLLRYCAEPRIAHLLRCA